VHVITSTPFLNMTLKRSQACMAHLPHKAIIQLL
jgi:hypothetical protein